MSGLDFGLDLELVFLGLGLVRLGLRLGLDIGLGMEFDQKYLL